MSFWLAGSVAVLGILLMWRLFRCAHAWELVDKTEFPSRLEEFVKQTNKVPKHVEDWRLPYCRKVVALVIRCSKCGSARVIKQSN